MMLRSSESVTMRLSNRPISPKTQLEQEKRIRREIANSNERRRMQSINSGFQSLRTLLPHHDGEKLSKAAILQHTADYIYQLEQEKTRLLVKNCQLKRLVNNQLGQDSDGSIAIDCDTSPLPKRIKVEKAANGADSSDSSDEGALSSATPTVTDASEKEPTIDDLRREMVELRVQLDRERKLRLTLEEQTRSLESQLYPERIREIAQNVQLQFQVNKLSDGSSQESSDALIASDEVVGETIEIETHSCPESPSQSLPALLFQSQTSENPLVGGTIIDVQPQDLSAKNTLSASKKSSSKSSAQPAAIALPIDVPFINADRDATSSTAVTVEIIAPGNISTSYSTTTASGGNSTSRQNLDTIVEAIRHLEGDHLFRDDVKPEAATEALGEIITETATSTSLSPALRTVLTMSPEQFGAIRHQVIQLQRPGVIVANHA